MAGCCAGVQVLLGSANSTSWRCGASDRPKQLVLHHGGYLLFGEYVDGGVHDDAKVHSEGKVSS
jgi:hypothetical protein